jgi:ribosomal protein L30E
MPTKKAPAKRNAKSAKAKTSKSVMVAEETTAERRKRLAEEKKLSGRKR